MRHISSVIMRWVSVLSSPGCGKIRSYFIFMGLYFHGSGTIIRPFFIQGLAFRLKLSECIDE